MGAGRSDGRSARGTDDAATPRQPRDASSGGPPAATGASQEEYQPHPRRWKALSVCLTVGFMTLLDVSIVNVALPSIERGIGAAESELSWVVSGYALTFGLVLIPSGRLGDAFGRRTAFLAGLVLFTLASAACGIAQDPTWLVVSRLVQGIAGGMLNPQISGMIQQLFRGAERGKAFGLLGMTIGVSTAVGPLLGGLLIQAFGTDEGWRWVFFVNLPIGVLAFLLALWLVPPSCAEKVSQGRPALDPVGVLLLGVGVLAVLLPLVEAQQWPGNGKWLLAAGGVVVLVLFTLWERRYTRRGKAPLVDLTLFNRRSYTLGSLLGLVYFAGFTTIFFIFTLYLQQGLKFTALHAGLTLTPFALGSAVSSGLGGRVVTRVGRPLVALGIVLVLVGLFGTLLTVRYTPEAHVGWVLIAPLLVAGLGSGFVISPNQTLTLHEVPVARAGTAGGMLQTGQRIGSAAGIASVGAVFFAHVSRTHDWSGALQAGLWAALAFVGFALVVAVADVYVGRRVRQ